MPSSGHRVPRPGRIPARTRRWLLSLCAAVLAAGVLTGPQATPAEAAPRRDASTGWILDVSPYKIASVVSTSGHTTVFVRGTDNRIWYRTGIHGSPWTPWTVIPNDHIATSGPSVATWDGDDFELVVRNTRNDAVGIRAQLHPTSGQPVSWGYWGYGGLGFGPLTTGPALASVDVGRWGAVTRGSDGAIYYAVYDWNGSPGPWTGWISLGGYGISAPTIEADFVGGQWRYTVSVVGADGRLWRRTVSAEHASAGPTGGWNGGRLPSSVGPGAVDVDSRFWGTPRMITVADQSGRVLLIDADTETTLADLGGVTTSPATPALNADGSLHVFVRGTDGQLWVDYVDGNGDEGWTPLGGVLT